MTYTLSTGEGFLRSDEIIARLDASVPLQLAHINSIREIEAEGCRYSNHDFDVLSAAYRAIGKTKIEPHTAPWVAHMIREKL